MRGIEGFSDPIEHIYDAAIEPARWSDAVASINAFAGARACGLISKDSINKDGVTHYYCGVDPHYIQLYADTHCRFDPLTTLPSFGRVVGIPDLLSYEDYRNGRFYQEWLRPQGSVDVVNVVLEQSNPKRPTLLTFLSGKRMMDNEMRQRIALLVPHAYRALLINKSLETKQSQTEALAATFDNLHAGVFFVDRDSNIVHANAAGHDILCTNDFLRSIGGRLVASDAKINRGLNEIFATDNPDAIASSGAAFVLNAHDGERYVAHVVPLAMLARHGAGMPARTIAALFVRKAEMDSQSNGELIARSFQLTPAELRVLLTIINVGGVRKSAETLEVAETTIKTHLKRVFAKTGAANQAELAKLTAGYCNPLVS